MSVGVRIARTLGWTVGAVVGAVGMGAVMAVRRPVPRTSGVLRLPGLQGRVQVLRDAWGVPHIYADTNADLFTALGFVHAQDRLWQMELNRRTAHGQLAEVFGPVALDSDRFMRTLGLSRVAHREVDLLDEHTRTVSAAYVQGINAFLHGNNPLPLECLLLRSRPRPWEMADILAWGKMLALSLSTNWTTELLNARLVAALGEEQARAVFPRYPSTHPLTVPSGISYSPQIGAGALQAATAAAPFVQHPGVGQGSNAWAISGERSASGGAMLASDPHLGIALPALWYEAHLEGGDYAVAGATFPGVPGVSIGHNTHIAWGITNAPVDVQDLYIERFHPDDPLRYEWCGAWEQAEVVREEILVKGQAEPVIEEVRLTRHGPVITPVATPESALQPTEDLALRWTALEPGQILRSILDFNRARNWDEFQAALAYWTAPPQNFIYADVEGHYGYAFGGSVPLRAQGDGRLPVPGWDGKHEWTGYVPTAALPAAYDPPEGVVLNANNSLVGETYAYSASLLPGEWMNGYRAARIQELLAATPRHDTRSFAQIQLDLHSLPGRELAQLVADVPLHDPLEIQARDLLVAWDGTLDADSVGGTIYSAVRYHLERRTYAEVDALLAAHSGLGIFGGIPGNVFLMRSYPAILARIAAADGPERRDPWLGAGRTWTSVLQESIALAVAELKQQLGPDPQTWHYGRVHTLTLRHPLGRIAALSPLVNRGPWPIGGDIETVCMGYIPRDSATGPIYMGPSYRQICHPSDWDASVSMLSSGQSGHPGSPHYADLTALWRTGEYHPMLWSRAQVERHTRAVLLLEPTHARQQHA